VTTLTLADLSIGADEVGLANATSEVVEFAPRPPKAAGVKITDEGDGGAKLVEFLASQKFV
jgi:electron transfer flavoprotein beta subunit